VTTHRAVPGLVIAALVVVAVCSVAVSAVGLRRDVEPQVVRAADPVPATPPRPEVAAAEVLAAWDADRAAAWAAGDVGRLRSLYAPGSVAGHHDVAMLRRWLDRGLVVAGWHTQVLSLREVRHSPHTWVLAVVDRVAGGTADGVRLPADAATMRTVTLRLRGDRWVVASVRGLRASRQAR
jgi:hypothetical protein